MPNPAPFRPIDLSQFTTTRILSRRGSELRWSAVLGRIANTVKYHAILASYRVLSSSSSMAARRGRRAWVDRAVANVGRCK